MANQKQLKVLKQGVDVWNKWREDNPNIRINFSNAKLHNAFLFGANLSRIDLYRADLSGAMLGKVDLSESVLIETNLSGSCLIEADLSGATLLSADLSNAILNGCKLTKANLAITKFHNNDLSETIGLEDVFHRLPSKLDFNTMQFSKGKISETFLRGCGLSDWEIESAKLYNPEINNEVINRILYKMYDLRASRSLQISPLFISYSHADTLFVDKLEVLLNEIGIRFWRDIHAATSGRLEEQIDRAIRQNPTVLLILSESSIKSDWVQHEARKARELEKEMGRDVLCPVALDDSWKSSLWPERIMEQVKEYNILDFSIWNDDEKFNNTFKKLIGGLNLYYKK